MEFLSSTSLENDPKFQIQRAPPVSASLLTTARVRALPVPLRRVAVIRHRHPHSGRTVLPLHHPYRGYISRPDESLTLAHLFPHFRRHLRSSPPAALHPLWPSPSRQLLFLLDLSAREEMG